MRYYWLKLKSDFFDSKRVKKLRAMAGGDTYLIIYLKMQLKALKTDGVLEYTGLEEQFADELALDIDERPDDVRVTLLYLLQYGLCECSDNVHYVLPWVAENTGSEGASAQRVRDCRSRKLLDAPRLSAKTNAERQSSFRAKQLCEKNGHVPFIEDYMNKKRYNGNYYLCFRRDKCRCAICGSVENLCMHHIDGYDENSPKNSDANKMLTLCRECHSKVHTGVTIPEEILESIGYFDDSNEICNTPVTQLKQPCNVEIEKEKDKEIEIDNRGRFTPPSVEQVREYCESRKNNVSPETFVDFYASKGWMVGKNRMKDWKAAVRTWEKNERPRKTNPALKYEQTPISEDDFSKLVVDLGGENE